MSWYFINIQLVFMYLFCTGNRYVTWLYKTDYAICQRQGLMRCFLKLFAHSLMMNRNDFRIYQGMMKQVTKFETLYSFGLNDV